MGEMEKAAARPQWDDWLPRSFFEWPAFMARWPERFGFLGQDEIKVEEYTDNETFVVKAELPGIDPQKDVEIDISDGRLRMRAERRKETKVEEKDYYRSELRYGAFSRTLPLPPGAKESDVKASYKDGILEVRVPMAHKAPATKIPITT
jgi:HSP20 family protein